MRPFQKESERERQEEGHDEQDDPGAEYAEPL